MFRKLRNKLIWINLSITTAVIAMTFTAIYFFATGAAKERPLMSEQQTMIISDEFTNTIDITLKKERQAAAQDLLLTLVVSGLIIEIAVAFASYYLADEAIKPVHEAYEAQKVFIANASHDIKTPLAAISANLEAADIHGNKWIANVERETEKLSTLNNELLALARTDLMQEKLPDFVQLKKLLNESLKSFESRLDEKQLTIKDTSRGAVNIVKADYVQVLNILLDNAIKYSDKRIVVRLSNQTLEISNDGAVLSGNEAEHVFERFYQVDKSAEGVGLGLSIAKSISERNGWLLTPSSEGKITKFTLKI